VGAKVHKLPGIIVSILNRLYPQFTDSMEKNQIGILDLSSNLRLKGHFIYNLPFSAYISLLFNSPL